MSTKPATPARPSPKRFARWWTNFLRPVIADSAMFRERPFPGLLFYVWTYPFTPAGKVVMLALAVSAAAGSITQDMPIYQLPVTLFALVLMASAECRA